MMSSRTVSTAAELKRAKEDNVDEIIVEGKLAKDLMAAKKITTLSAAALGTLTAAIAAGVALTPVTGGVSLGVTAAVAGPIALASGVSIPAIILASVIGVSILLAIFKEYDCRLEVSTGRVILRLKSNRKKEDKEN